MSSKDGAALFTHMRRVNDAGPPFPPDDLTCMQQCYRTNMLVPEDYAACNVYEKSPGGPILFYAWTVDGFRVFLEFNRDYWLLSRPCYLVKDMLASALKFKRHSNMIYLTHTERQYGYKGSW